MSLFSTREKLKFAQWAIDEFAGQSIGNYDDQINQLKKLELYYNKSKRYTISDFGIKLSKIPSQHLWLMATIGWLTPNRSKPTKCVRGFYKNNIRNGQSKYFITVNKYIYLLLIECELRDMYTNAKAKYL